MPKITPIKKQRSPTEELIESLRQSPEGISTVFVLVRKSDGDVDIIHSGPGPMEDALVLRQALAQYVDGMWEMKP